MRSLWNGSISFGLVNIPVKMFAATKTKTIRFRSLHKKCHTPIRYQRFCPRCEEQVESEDIVKGYEYEKGQFVIIGQEELERLPVAQTKSIEILDFVSLAEIDPVYFDRSYYLSPTETGVKAYKLLLQALTDSERIAVAKLTIREKQHLCVVRAYQQVLVLETIFYPDEVRAVDDVPNTDREVSVSDRELEMARQLIDTLTDTFNPEKYRDESREELLALIEAKISGQEVTIPEVPRAGQVVDLMEALRASVEAVKKEKQTRRQGTGY